MGTELMNQVMQKMPKFEKNTWFTRRINLPLPTSPKTAPKTLNPNTT